MVGKKRSPLAKGSRAVETREPKVIEKICVLFSFKHLVDMDDVGQSLTQCHQLKPQKSIMIL